DARQHAFEQLWQEAEAQIAAGDLERALESACQAQALDPGRPEIVALVDEIYDRLAGTFRPPEGSAPGPPSMPPARVTVPPPLSPPPARPTTPMGSIRQRGASAFRELATFGEPP